MLHSATKSQESANKNELQTDVMREREREGRRPPAPVGGAHGTNLTSKYQSEHMKTTHISTIRIELSKNQTDREKKAGKRPEKGQVKMITISIC